MDNNNNYSYSTYPDSNASTPRSRELDPETASYDDNPHPNLTNYKVKLMCSYGGKILPRPHDNQLTYIGGDTKILTVDRNIRYASISNKLISIVDTSDICFKYQLPGEDLDALISVTNDEDLDHMMTEYDRIFRSSVKPVRLRLFVFPFSSRTFGTGSGESKTDQQWFVDALNAVQISPAPALVPAPDSSDFLFGFDNGIAPVPVAVPVPVKVHDVSAVVVTQTNVSECGSEESNSNSISNSNGNSNRLVISDPVCLPAVDIQRQMHHVGGVHEQTNINIDPRVYYGDYYGQKVQPPAATGQPRYWQEQRGYPMSMSVAGTDSPMYLIPSSTGVYPPVPAPVQASQGLGQTYYGMQRMVNAPDFYREQAQIQQPKYQEAVGVVRPHSQAEIGYGQVYYTTSQGVMTPSYQPVVAGSGQLGLAVNQEGKMVVNPPNKVP